jgi:hypothetical protein
VGVTACTRMKQKKKSNLEKHISVVPDDQSVNWNFYFFVLIKEQKYYIMDLRVCRTCWKLVLLLCTFNINFKHPKSRTLNIPSQETQHVLLGG